MYRDLPTHEQMLMALNKLIDMMDGDDFLERFDNFWLKLNSNEQERILEFFEFEDSIELYDELVYYG